MPRPSFCTQRRQHELQANGLRILGGVLYGDVPTPAPETAPANPISPYGITKWVGEKYLEFYAREHGLRSVALRYSNVYGPRQNPHGEAGVVAIFCNQLLDSQPARINGDGKYVRDYVYGPDVATANLAALSLDKSHFREKEILSLNIGTGMALTSMHSKRTCVHR